MTHIIRRQYLHVDLRGSEQEALSLQIRLPEWCEQHLYPMLDRVLDRLVPEHEYWSLENLEIDVERIELSRLDSDLPVLVEQALDKALRRQWPKEPGEIAVERISESQARHRTELASPIPSPAIQRHSRSENLDAALAYFLKTGTLPWSFKPPQDSSLEQMLLDSWREQHPGECGTIQEALQSEIARMRLMRQFSESFVIDFLKWISPPVHQLVRSIQSKLEASDLPSDIRKILSKRILQSAVALAPSSVPNLENDLIEMVWRFLPRPIAEATGLKTFVEKNWPGSFAAKNQLPQSKHGTRTAPTRQVSDNSIAQSDQSFQDFYPVPETENSPGGLAHHVDDTSVQAFRQHPEAAEGLYIENAGLVLLHPFLPQLFQALDIADYERILQAERALCLLHFLASGRTSAPEYELILPKLLLNIPLLEPVDSAVHLKQNEIDEAEALLAAVIRHWEVLKNTGIDGLRGSFLMRNGKITLREDGDWLLQVEGQACDILLDQLPWGIGAIKLPWMEPMLWVEWNTGS